MEDLILITTTSDDRKELEAIARHLIEKKLAACCQVGDQSITSWYTWKSQTESTTEWVCSIKTLGRLFPEVQQAIAKLHHYNEPQIVAVEICAASDGYRKWVCDSVQDAA